MRFLLSFLALAAPLAPAFAQTAQPAFQLEAAPIQVGGWTYRTQAGISDATFVTSAGQARMAIRCTMATRRVSISTPVPAAIGGMTVWTSDGARTLASRFEQGQAVADLPANDALLDSLAFSRGRFAVSLAGMAPLTFPSAPEIARAVEDCRS